MDQNFSWHRRNSDQWENKSLFGWSKECGATSPLGGCCPNPVFGEKSLLGGRREAAQPHPCILLCQCWGALGWAGPSHQPSPSPQINFRMDLWSWPVATSCECILVGWGSPAGVCAGCNEPEYPKSHGGIPGRALYLHPWQTPPAATSSQVRRTGDRWHAIISSVN